MVPLINQLKVSHSTLMVALLSRVVTPQTGPYGEVLRKQPEPPKESLNKSMKCITLILFITLGSKG
jgi:hypothetical protein